MDMTFTRFTEAVRTQLDLMTADGSPLFLTDVGKDEFYDAYLNSFAPEDNTLFRERTEMDCNACKSFLRQVGMVVKLVNNRPVSIWDIDVAGTKFEKTTKVLSELVKSRPVVSIFLVDRNGSKKDTVLVGSGPTIDSHDNSIVWHHLSYRFPRSNVAQRDSTQERAEIRENAQILERSLTQISPEALEIVLELITQNSLYRGDQWGSVLGVFKSLQNDYLSVDPALRPNFCWQRAAKGNLGMLSRLKNHSIGTLLVNLTSGMNLDTAVSKYESIVSAGTYQRPQGVNERMMSSKAAKRMIEKAKQTMSDLGYLDSLQRRFATVNDLTIEDILFADRSTKASVLDSDPFAELSNGIRSEVPDFSRVKEVSIQDFIEKFVPTLDSMEVYFANDLKPNLVSLLTSENPDAKSMFKWGNNYGWAYSGSVADSEIKRNVKSQGGRVENTVLRCSIQWNEQSDNPDDLDAHMKEPNGNEIFFENKGRRHRSSGMLDVDITRPGREVAVENIYYDSLNSMPAGNYRFFVHNYAHRGGCSGFRAEIECASTGKVYSFDYPTKVGRDVEIAVIKKHRDGRLEVIPTLDPQVSKKDSWGIQMNDFHKVEVLMTSPNYWEGANQTGAKHYFFMLEGAVNDENPNGFFNEFLRPELKEHKRVMESLSYQMKVADSEDQLSGLGFSSTRTNSVIVRTSGKINQLIKVTF